MGKKVIYSSNNAVRSEEKYMFKFNESGINSTFVESSTPPMIYKIKFIRNFLQEDVIHPGTAAVEYLKQTNFKGLIYLIGSPTLKDLIESAGYEVHTGVGKTV